MKGLFKDALCKPFDKAFSPEHSRRIRANGNIMVPFVLSLSKHERSTLGQRILKRMSRVSPFGRNDKNKSKGFTLLETLVALAILAIALAAVMRATSGSTSNADAMRMRVLADWVAQNRLALHAARNDFLPVGIQNGEETQAGVKLLWKEEISVTPNQAFRRIEVSVYEPARPDYALRKLSGFLVQ